MSFIFIILMILFLTPNEYDYTFESKDFIVEYSYAKMNKKKYLIGHIRHKRGGNHALNTNITIIGYPIGTVPQKDGTFTIELPQNQGEILFFKDGFKNFTIHYKIIYPIKVYLYAEKDRVLELNN